MARQNVIIGTLNVPVDLIEAGAQMAQIAPTEADMTEQNAQGGVIGWVTPDYEKMHMAWNSARYVAFQMLYAVTGVTIPQGAPKALVPGTQIYYFINTEYTGEVSMAVTDAGGRQYSLVADCMRTEYQGVTFTEGSGEGGAQFDVAIFARAAYKRITHLTDNTLTWLTISPVSVSRLWLINGVVQQGESSEVDWLQNGVRLLTRQTVLQPWGANAEGEYGGDFNDDFNDDFAMQEVIAGGDFNDDFNDDFATQEVIAGGDPEVTLLTVTEGVPSTERVLVHDIDDMQQLNDLLGEPLLSWMPKCRGFALRWLNAQGGVDGFVFTPRSRVQRKAKTSGYVNVYSPDPYNVKDTINVYEVQSEDILILGVDGLPKDMYNVLKWIPVSRDVAVYMPGVSVPENRWQSVTVEDYDVTDSDVQNAVDFEIKIKLPKLNMMA